MDKAKELAEKDLLHLKAESINGQSGGKGKEKNIGDVVTIEREEANLAKHVIEHDGHVTNTETIVDLISTKPGATENDKTMYVYNTQENTYYFIKPLDATAEINIGDMTNKILACAEQPPYTEGDIERDVLKIG